MKKLFLSILLGLTGSAMSLFAVPAKLTPFKVTQPDGSTVMLRLTGDERSHMMMTTEGYPVARNEAGYYCFADVTANGEVKPTSVKAALVSDLSSADRLKVDAINPAIVRKTLAQRNSSRINIETRASGHTGIGLSDDAFLGYKELKGLVILAEFPDKKFDPKYGKAYFTDLLNEEGFSQYNATGSARDYFIASSDGAFVPQFDVYGPVTMPNNMAYYGANDAYGNDLRPEEMIRDACKALDGEINFKDYDIDGDKYVDNVFVFYAGYGEASSDIEDTIWPHQWKLSAARISLTLDGVKIDKYACTNELQYDEYGKTEPCGIGTFVHEFSHVLGLPDLYVTNGSDGYWTPCYWSVMDQGSYSNNGKTPPAYSAYERNALGWCDPIELFEPATVSLEAISTSNKACIIPTLKQNEFFLLENRQQVGWDKYLPGHGLLIWHIDYNKNIWFNNSVNNTMAHNYVDIEEACGEVANVNKFLDRYGYLDINKFYEALAGYTFPGPNGVTSFTDDTKPSMKTWSGSRLNLPLTEITEKNGVIKFNVAGGYCYAGVPEVLAPSEVGHNWFVANWNAAPGVDHYELTVENTVTSGLVETVSTDFGKAATAELPEGWSFIGMKDTDVYKTSGNFGQSAPSLKFATDGCGFMTKEFDSFVKSVSFWTKGQGTDGISYIVVEGLIGDDWVELEKVYPISYKVVTAEINDVPDGVRQVRVTYFKSKGNVSLDDFALTLDGAGTIALKGYNNLNVGNVTSYRVEDIPADAGVITYKVRAVDSYGCETDYSESELVTFNVSGIDAVTVGGEAVCFVKDGAVVYSGVAGARLTLYDFGGRVVTTAVAGSDGTGELRAPSAGAYILVAPGLSTKVIVVDSETKCKK